MTEKLSKQEELARGAFDELGRICPLEGVESGHSAAITFLNVAVVDPVGGDIAIQEGHRGAKIYATVEQEDAAALTGECGALQFDVSLGGGRYRGETYIFRSDGTVAGGTQVMERVDGTDGEHIRLVTSEADVPAHEELIDTDGLSDLNRKLRGIWRYIDQLPERPQPMSIVAARPDIVSPESLATPVRFLNFAAINRVDGVPSNWETPEGASLSRNMQQMVDRFSELLPPLTDVESLRQAISYIRQQQEVIANSLAGAGTIADFDAALGMLIRLQEVQESGDNDSTAYKEWLAVMSEVTIMTVDILDANLESLETAMHNETAVLARSHAIMGIAYSTLASQRGTPILENRSRFLLRNLTLANNPEIAFSNVLRANFNNLLIQEEAAQAALGLATDESYLNAAGVNMLGELTTSPLVPSGLKKRFTEVGLKPIFERYGLDYDALRKVWDQSRTTPGLATGESSQFVNLRRMLALEGMRKGICKELYKRYSIVNFHRWPLDALIDQYDNLDSKARYGTVTAAAADPEDALAKSGDMIGPLHKKLKELGILLRIHEVDNKSDLIRSNVRTGLRNGPAAFRIIIGHGITSPGDPDPRAEGQPRLVADAIWLGSGRDDGELTASDVKATDITPLMRKYNEPGCETIFVSCGVGEDEGLVEAISYVYPNSEFVAPSRPVTMVYLEPQKRRDGTVHIVVSYEGSDTRRYSGGMATTENS